jgi:hypothetical protein
VARLSVQTRRRTGLVPPEKTMKGSLLFLLSILLGVSLVAGQCPTFDRIFNYTVGMNLPWGFYETGIPNIILNEHNQVVRTDNEPGQPMNFAALQGVSYTYYGAPICAVVFDCGANESSSVSATVSNVNTNQTWELVLNSLCTQPGLFFGCIDTSYNPPAGDDPGVDVVVGEFGDQILISYTSAQPISGDTPMEFQYSIWLTCQETQNWTFETISSLMLQDSISRNLKKLYNLQSKILLIQEILFGSENITCEDISTLVNLSPAALSSFEFLDECIIYRNIDASAFLSHVEQIDANNYQTW